MQAIVEVDCDVYAAFAKLPDASSRNFTAWQPDSVRMKIGAIFETTSISRAGLCRRLPTPVRRVVQPGLSRRTLAALLVIA
jgi:hypothetical protein